MINLIPIEEKKEIKKHFFYRALVVSFVMLILVVVILIIAISPAYFISLEKKMSVNKKLEMQKNEMIPEIDQKALIEIKSLDARLSLLESARINKYVFSKKVIDQILSEKVVGIKIKRISYQNDLLEGKKVNIAGIAQNREQLLVFRQALESDPTFVKVDLPISNFVKGENIEFNLNLISK